MFNVEVRMKCNINFISYFYFTNQWKLGGF